MSSLHSFLKAFDSCPLCARHCLSGGLLFSFLWVSVLVCVLHAYSPKATGWQPVLPNWFHSTASLAEVCPQLSGCQKNVKVSGITRFPHFGQLVPQSFEKKSPVLSFSVSRFCFVPLAKLHTEWFQLLEVNFPVIASLWWRALEITKIRCATNWPVWFWSCSRGYNTVRGGCSQAKFDSQTNTYQDS